MQTEFVYFIIDYFYLGLTAHIDKRGVQGIVPQYLLITDDVQFLACTCDCHIQLAVYNPAILLEAVGCKEVKLAEMPHCGGIDDYITLRTLVSLYGVYAHIGKLRNAIGLGLAAYHSYLVTVGYDNSNGCLRTEAAAILLACLSQQTGNDACLGNIHFLRRHSIRMSLR